MATTTRRLFVVVLGVMAASVAAASVAFACANLTTLKFSTDSAAAGSSVDFRLDRFRNGEGFSDIVMTFETRDGAVVWAGPAGDDRGASGSITVPDVAPGHYAFIATQTDAEGKPVSGAPARASLQITGGAAGASVSAQEAPAAAAAPAAPAEEAAAPAAAAPAPAAAATAPVQASTAPAAAATEAAPATQAATSSAPTAAASTPVTEQGAAASAATPAEATTATLAQPTAFDRFAAVERAAAAAQYSAAATVATAPAAELAAAQPAGATAAAQTALAEVPALASTLALWMLGGVAAFGLAVLATRRRGLGMAVARF